MPTSTRKKGFIVSLTVWQWRLSCFSSSNVVSYTLMLSIGVFSTLYHLDELYDRFTFHYPQPIMLCIQFWCHSHHSFSLLLSLLLFNLLFSLFFFFLFSAADVTQSVNFFLTVLDLSTTISAEDLLAIFVASIIHDMRHPGITEQFLVDAGHEIAMTYNDIYVLENYHCASTFHLLSRPQTDIFACK